MNLIHLIKPTATIFRQPEEQQVIYMYMLSNCVEDSSGEIFCAYSVTDLRSVFLKFNDIIDDLLDTNLIQNVGRRFLLGEDGRIFANNQSPFQKEIGILAECYEDLAKRPKKAIIATNKWTTLEKTYFNNSHNIASGQTLANIFSLTYFLVYGEEFPRSFTGKEIGQFNHLFKYYGAINSVKMIINYVNEATNPNIGSLLVYKDSWYSKAAGADKKRPTLTDKETQYGDFK